MSRTTAERTCIQVPVTDAEGCEAGFSVYVYADYTVEVDTDYGADADGRRGALRVSHHLGSLEIDSDDRKLLTDDQAAKVLADARELFYHTPKHF